MRFQGHRGGDRVRRRFVARDAGRLCHFWSECVRLRVEPYSCLDIRKSSFHPSCLSTLTSSDRTELVPRRRSISFSISTGHLHCDSEGGTSCRRGYVIVSY